MRYGKHPYYETPAEAQRAEFREEIARETEEFKAQRTAPGRVLPTLN